MLTILDLNEEVHGLSKACDGNQLCNQCIQLCVSSVQSAACVSSVQWMMGTVVQGEVQQLVLCPFGERVTSGGE